MGKIFTKDMQELNFYADIFSNETAAFDYLCSLNKLHLEKNCTACNSSTKIVVDDKYHLGKYLRCTSTTCRKKYIALYTFFERPKIELHKFLRYIYGFCIEFDTKQMNIVCGISKNTLINLNEKIIEILSQKYSVCHLDKKKPAKL